MSNELVPNSQNNLPKIFSFGDYKIRVVAIEGKPWFFASDICQALKFSNTSKAIKDNCKTSHNKSYTLIDSNGRHHEYILIDKKNIIRLIMKSTERK